MELKLQADNESLIEGFFDLKTREDVVNLLEVDLKTLNYYLYRYDKNKQYLRFEIPKKNGKNRVICTPTSRLKIIQKKLNYILKLIYKQKPSAHGFAKDKSIKTNANNHKRKKFVFNIDINEFFPTINFGRVRGLLINEPYNIAEEAATVLAQICTHNNQLPQGAPTSPVVSNMICSRLDTELQNLANSNNCTYTRYADDISFSASTNKPPKTIVRIIKRKDKSTETKPGRKLEGIVKKNGFEINKNKTRINFNRGKLRQEVTGLVVNEKVNVNRRYIKLVRAILYSWETKGYKKAESIFITKKQDKRKTLKTSVLGMINFIRHIRGEDDVVYRRLMNRYYELLNIDVRLPLSNTEEIQNNIWVIETDDVNNAFQGTAFMLRDHSFVTCAHVLKTDKAYIFKTDNPNKKYPIKNIKKHEVIDLAIFEIEDKNTRDQGLEVNKKFKPQSKIEVFIAGFQSYSYGSEPTILKTPIVTTKVCNSIKRGVVEKIIMQGMSGGPTLDENNNVIGVLAKGWDKNSNPDESTNEFIPISALKFLKDNPAEDFLTGKETIIYQSD